VLGGVLYHYLIKLSKTMWKARRTSKMTAKIAVKSHWVAVTA